MMYRCVCLCVQMFFFFLFSSGAYNRHQMTGSAVHLSLYSAVISALVVTQLGVIKCESYLFAVLRIFVHFWTLF